MTRPLLAKLGHKPGMAALVVGLPDGVAGLEALPTVAAGDLQFQLGFAADAAALAQRIAAMVPRYRPGGLLWFAYPKKSGRLRSDIDRDHGWEALTAQELLAVTQVAIDADWSALRFRHRAEIAKLTRTFA